MESDGSLLCSEGLVICFYPEPDAHLFILSV